MRLRQIQTLLGIVLAMLLAGAALSACGGDDGDQPESGQAKTTQQPAKSGGQGGKTTAQGSGDNRDSGDDRKSGGDQQSGGATKADGNGQDDSAPSKAGKDAGKQTASPKKQRDTETAEAPSPEQSTGQTPCPSSLSQQACDELVEGFRGEGSLANGECPKGLTDQQCQELKSAFAKAPK